MKVKSEYTTANTSPNPSKGGEKTTLVFVRKQLPLFRRGVGGGVSGLLRSAHNDGGVGMEGIPHCVRNDGNENVGGVLGGGGYAAATTSPANTRHSEQSEETIIN